MRVFAVVGLAWLAVCSWAPAQPQKPPSSGGTVNFIWYVGDENAARRGYEEIEIMRRVLNRTLAKLRSTRNEASSLYLLLSPELNPWMTAHGGADLGVRLSEPAAESTFTLTDSAKNTYRIQGDNRGAAETPDVEGTYLPGYGVVFSATLPVRYIKLTHPATSEANSAPSEWERAKSELRGDQADAGLRGDRVDAEDKKPEQPRVSLTDAVLKALADNGHHLSQLSNKSERLTVAITLRPTHFHFLGRLNLDMQPKQQGQDSKADREGSQSNLNLAKSGDAPNSANAQLAQARNFAAAVQNQLDDNPASASYRSSANNYSHLGDMRLKAGRARESIEAYTRAVDEYQKLIESYKAGSNDDWWQQKVKAAGQAAEAYSKLAQAYLLQGEEDRAYKILKRAAELAGWANSGKGSKPGDDSAKIALPAKLIISATKQQLDDVAAEKITFEAFKKAVEVQSLSFPSENPKPSGTGQPLNAPPTTTPARD